MHLSSRLPKKNYDSTLTNYNLANHSEERKPSIAFKNAIIVKKTHQPQVLTTDASIDNEHIP
jgi:hypothetical protein